MLSHNYIIIPINCGVLKWWKKLEPNNDKVRSLLCMWTITPRSWSTAAVGFSQPLGKHVNKSSPGFQFSNSGKWRLREGKLTSFFQVVEKRSLISMTQRKVDRVVEEPGRVLSGFFTQRACLNQEDRFWEEHCLQLLVNVLHLATGLWVETGEVPGRLQNSFQKHWVLASSETMSLRRRKTWYDISSCVSLVEGKSNGMTWANLEKQSMTMRMTMFPSADAGAQQQLGPTKTLCWDQTGNVARTTD